MQKAPSFTIYDASAGSGKTFTLVKEYLKLLFQSNSPGQFKRILAITFTNKAVGEMKERIVSMLKLFSNKSILISPHDMFVDICKDLDLQPDLLHEKSKSILEDIIHNYAAFDISTIDGFTHRLIRTFAYDLKLPLNFEVELDQDALLFEAVDKLIAKAGTDQWLTKTIIDFAIEKTDDDKSWDISFDFNKIAKLLTSEDHVPYVKKLKDKSIEDFKTLKTQLKVQIKNYEAAIIEKAQSVLSQIEQAGLEFKDFSSGYLPKHFEQLTKGKFDIAFGNKWQEDLETKTLYPKRVTHDIASTIESIQPQLALAFEETKQGVFQLKFLKAFYKNLTPLSVLNAINNELQILKEEQNKMLISEFNTIISNEIKNQPTPFIYERLGEKFNHYFIDEFQDTSVLQWQNLMPLLSNSLASEKGSAMLVGDAKQAIYRWRGGKAEQFIDLYNENETPFPIKQNVKSLPTNYRSYTEIVNFNNTFFKFLANQVFSKEDYKNLYKSAHQNASKKDSGYVELSFLNIEREDNKDELYPEKVLSIIQNCLDNGYEFQDICVLVRKKKEGIAVADYLSQRQIRIMSSETLLLNNAPEIVFINHILALLIQPKNHDIKVGVLNYLASKWRIDNKHQFFVAHMALPVEKLFQAFENFNVFINSTKLMQLPLYELGETIVREFHLTDTSHAYIQFYLDVVLDYTLKKGSDIKGFLDYFEKKKDNLSIVSPQGQNAVQIMTVHKSKGLEFPIVIFPYADLDIYRELEPKEWFPIDPELFNGFSHTLLNYNKDFENYGESGKQIYANHQAALELDNINLLYVALTRPVKQLYIVSKNENTSKGDISNKKYSGLFINFLKHLNVWNDSQLDYRFGHIIPATEGLDENKKNIQDYILEQDTFISSAKENHNIKVVTNAGYLWDSVQQEAIEKGNLIHDIMARIETREDVEDVLLNFIRSGKINNTQSKALHILIHKIIEHPSLIPYYQSNATIYNEQDIITKEGLIFRPDRIVINSEKEAVIIDYKTGLETLKHKNQLLTYQALLEDMSFKVIKKILVYTNDDLQVLEV
ncbi:UvrD-helicase domain-containing protein [Mariniflexile ostreae]|uniref:DNA 3'-5' helicase n=1 Tax=Mariniflexile ostreae TaxID=1520892 RepID=A0ABV5F7W6_9FLAO